MRMSFLAVACQKKETKTTEKFSGLRGVIWNAIDYLCKKIKGLQSIWERK